MFSAGDWELNVPNVFVLKCKKLMEHSKAVLITGAAGGIGYATAQTFHNEGWTVIGLDYQASDDLNLEAIDQYIQVDLADAIALENAIAAIQNDHPHIHSVVNNAAYQVCKAAVDTTIFEWDQVMAVNVRAAFLLAKGLYPSLKATNGSIVNVSSVHAIATSANISAYAASKGALLALTRALAIEFAPEVRVNALLPGAVNTPMLQAGLQRGHLTGENMDDLLSDLGGKTIMGRVGEPKEIADAILFLADGDRSSFMTGQSLVVDGGALTRLSTE